MNEAYIVRRGDVYAIQKVATDDKGRQREVYWADGLTREDAIAQAADCVLRRLD